MEWRPTVQEMLSARSELDKHNNASLANDQSYHKKDDMQTLTSNNEELNLANKNIMYIDTSTNNHINSINIKLRNRSHLNKKLENSNTASIEMNELTKREYAIDSDEKKNNHNVNIKDSVDTFISSYSTSKMNNNNMHVYSANTANAKAATITNTANSKYSTHSNNNSKDITVSNCTSNNVIQLKHISSSSYLFECDDQNEKRKNKLHHDDDNDDDDDYGNNNDKEDNIDIVSIASDLDESIDNDKNDKSYLIKANKGAISSYSKAGQDETCCSVRESGQNIPLSYVANNVEFERINDNANAALLRKSEESNELPFISVSPDALTSINTTTTESSLLPEVALIKSAAYEVARLRNLQETATHPETTTLPLWQSFILAFTYVFASIGYFLCIRYSRATNKYNSAFLVFVIELTKLIVSAFMQLAHERNGFLLYTVIKLTSCESRKLWRDGLPYALPSLLYAVYNNLTFYNLSRVDPGTYQVIMQTRILFTGILFTFFLKTDLSIRKWFALLLLTIGVTTKYIAPDTSMHMNMKSVTLILLQALLSALAGVYNEYVLKKQVHMSIHEQNFFMYFYALIFNTCIGAITDPASYSLQTFTNWSQFAKPIFILIVFFGATTGLAAAFILKFINVIVKAFASAIEVLLTAVLAALVLNEILTFNDVVASVIVMTSVYLYYTNGKGNSYVVHLRCW